MRLRKLYPAIALITFLVGLTASYSIRAVSNRLIDSRTIDEVPPQALFDEATESRDVYSAILQQSFIRHRYRTLVIKTTSENSLLMDTDLNTGTSPTVEQLYGRERVVMPVELATVADYAHKNETQAELFLKDLGITSELISQEEAARLFGKDGGGWEAFYQRYPGSLGLVSFSKVGFNSTHDQAFVYVAQTCQSTCGEGEYVLLNKDSGRWIVTVVEGIWES